MISGITLLLGLIISILPVQKSFFSFGLPSEECDVQEFFEAVQPDSGVKVLTYDGRLEEAELILIPTRMETGTFKIEITRKGSNVYKVEGTSYFIETRYCYEYATYDDAILRVESNYGYTKGTVFFD